MDPGLQFPISTCGLVTRNGVCFLFPSLDHRGLAPCDECGLAPHSIHQVSWSLTSWWFQILDPNSLSHLPVALKKISKLLFNSAPKVPCSPPRKGKNKIKIKALISQAGLFLRDECLVWSGVLPLACLPSKVIRLSISNPSRHPENSSGKWKAKMALFGKKEQNMKTRSKFRGMVGFCHEFGVLRDSVVILATTVGYSGMVWRNSALKYPSLKISLANFTWERVMSLL